MVVAIVVTLALVFAAIAVLARPLPGLDARRPRWVLWLDLVGRDPDPPGPREPFAPVEFLDGPPE